jgi:hypothetical protein
MDRNKAAALLAAAALCAAVTGCGKTFKAETVLHADGSIDRAVYQPADSTPDDARAAGVWRGTTFALPPDCLDKEGWPAALTALPPHDRGGDYTYFAGWNHFASVADIPDYVVFKAPPGPKLPDGKLVRSLERTDLIFAAEFRWRETLTDSVTQEDMRKARDELADLMIEVGQDVFTEALGKDYDASDLVKYLRGEGKEWLAEMTDVYFARRAGRGEADRSGSLEDALLACCARHGLKLTTADGKPLPPEASKQAVNDFLAEKVGSLVKKGGKPVGKEEAAKWLEELNSNDGGRFGAAARKVIETKYGGEQAFNARVGALLARVLGLYQISEPLHFDYTMALPGPVAEANGELLAGNRVRWRFNADQAYPFGYTMSCRCVVADEAAQKAVLEGAPLADRDALLRYVELVRGDDNLLAALKKCREGRSLKPLEEYAAGSFADEKAAKSRAEQVLKLLKGA